MEPEGRRIPVKLEAWRVESPPEARKSAVKPANELEGISSEGGVEEL